MDITSYIMGSIAGAKSASGLKYLVVDELPEIGADNTIYLVPKSSSGTNNYYDEYMYINEDWEKIGDTEIDLSDYQHTMQYAVVPNATADNLGKIIQYTGTTTASYTNGYFYQCVSDGEPTPIYSWSNIDIQDSSDGVSLKNDNGKSIFLYLDKLEPGIINTTGYSRTIFIYNTENGSPIAFFNNYYALDLIYIYKKMEDAQNGDILIYWNTDEGEAVKIKKDTTQQYNVSISYSTSPFLKYALYKNVLSKNNTTAFTPSGDYNPATKKYVDDSIASAIGTALQGNY